VTSSVPMSTCREQPDTPDYALLRFGTARHHPYRPSRSPSQLPAFYLEDRLSPIDRARLEAHSFHNGVAPIATPERVTIAAVCRGLEDRRRPVERTARRSAASGARGQLFESAELRWAWSISWTPSERWVDHGKPETETNIRIAHVS
jgi:hypothetical protein